LARGGGVVDLKFFLSRLYSFITMQNLVTIPQTLCVHV